MNVFFDLTIGLEVWGAVFTLLIFIAVCMEKEKTKNRYYFAAMQLTCFIYIAADILSRIARGKTEVIYQIITRISIFLFYFLDSSSFTHFSTSAMLLAARFWLPWVEKISS